MDQALGKICPACEHVNPSEADTCLFCGAPLEAYTPSSESSTINLEGKTSSTAPAEPPLVAPPARGIALYLAEQSQPILLVYEEEFILGRASETNKPAGGKPLIDLEPYGARAQGVSRQHLLIRRARGGYEAIDLNSANGTYLDEQRLAPRLPYPLHNGAMLRLGHLRLFLTFRFRGEEA